MKKDVLELKSDGLEIRFYDRIIHIAMFDEGEISVSLAKLSDHDIDHIIEYLTKCKEYDKSINQA